MPKYTEQHIEVSQGGVRVIVWCHEDTWHWSAVMDPASGSAASRAPAWSAYGVAPTRADATRRAAATLLAWRDPAWVVRCWYVKSLFDDDDDDEKEHETHTTSHEDHAHNAQTGLHLE